MRKPKWIASDVARILHDLQLASFGGPSGIRDENLLESALARPKNLFSFRKPAPSLPELAAAYAFGIVRNHPFLDGNKRTGLLIAFTFLELNGLEVYASEEDAYDVFMRLASGALTEQALAKWLVQNSRRRSASARS